MARNILENEGKNNSRNTAESVGSIENGGVVVQGAQIGVGSDVSDFYQLNITRPTQLNTSLIPKSANANFRLLDSNGNPLITSSRGGTSEDTIFVPNLTKGTYFLEVTRVGSNATNYDLSITGAAVTNAQMSVTVDRIRAIDGFELFPFDKPDFFVQGIEIEGNRSGRSRTFDNQPTASPNFSHTRSVNINDKDITAKILVQEDDTPFFAQEVDVNPGSFSLIFDYNPSANAVRTFSNPNSIAGRGGSPIISRGDGISIGSSPKRAELIYTVNYNSFTSSSAFNQLNRSSTEKGNNRSNTLVGQDVNGILDGGRGHDNLSGMGGHDALIGNFGNDTMNGGKGRDITWGGSGNDVHIGWTGRDTFVLDLTKGVDVIKDYRDGVDKIGLTNGIVYELLDIRQEKQNTGIYLEERKLGVVENVRPQELKANDFVQVSFVTIKDIVTPYVM